MNTTLEYVFRTALGQCSTIPMSTADPADMQQHNNNGAYDYSHHSRMVSDNGLRDGAPYHQQWASDEMSTTPLMMEGGGGGLPNNNNTNMKNNTNNNNNNNKNRSGGGGKLHKDLNMHKLFGAVKQTIGATGNTNNATHHYPQGSTYAVSSASPNASSSPRNVLVLPPESAVRTRCYRLNLNTDLFTTTNSLIALGGTTAANINTPASPTIVSGPFRCDGHAALGDRTVDAVSTYVGFSPSLDDSIADDHRDNTVSTARIFRGLTVNNDGSIVSHHHRSKGAGPKRDEKSRQSAKIDKAVEMAEDAVRKGETKQIKTLSSGSRDDAECENKMISLVIFGEYDDMKGLVRDGAKRLKENQNALDEALWALNKQRIANNNMMNSNMSEDWGNSGQDYQRKNGKIIPGATPPKLHRHPRDRPGSSTRKEMARNASTNNASRGKGFPPWKKNADDGTVYGNGAGESDWSDALLFSKGLYSMCVCGANSVSPTNGAGKYGDNSSIATNNNHGSSTNNNVGIMNNTHLVTAKEGRDAPPVVAVSNYNKGNIRYGTSDGRDGAYGRAKDSIMVL
mmetsp:Transcript_20753/g.29591  ORF Transcript_20753/g.29591 Transcript_20753/m.29591 type:complete len:567 (+) Transcript_20753:168-1868(+)|eukprot:CAMPEP_0172414780 /NCGR_PEP_ID=MMETSP1064-20121228/1401_1 /TAXON_ID=202472 /ORGANISM="Aulacoseira subarctica , Strain CCAP 1002/5" /LENGTH=566 /DNA_ID=CAMNT_0013151601 /DNA_START=160 /DNA_END=1860 /DNA_ORIENTATION=-